MNERHDPNMTADVPSAPADSLDAGLAAGFGRLAEGPRSTLDATQRPVLLRDAEGESAHVVKPKSDAMPLPEQIGGRYQLSGEIARGGMGAVLRGRDVDLGRDLAVKVLLEKYANRPEVARRFIEEAQIAGQLQHPGVVPVYDIGRFGDRPFFTMKLVKGQTLAAMLAGRNDLAVDRPRLLAITLQVAQTLAYAHAKGVIHRDLKPANIMVGAFGEVQVMDWGLAKVLAEGGIADEERASRAQEQPEDVTTIRTARSSGTAGSFGSDTEAGSLLGTPAYMPPEQANGDVASLDRRADVFGLGSILCEILTGKAPYVGRSHEEVRRKAANGDMAPALARLDGCGAEKEVIGLTKVCLSPEAIDRPKDAQAVAEALTAYLDGVQERLRQAVVAEAQAKARAVEEAKRRRLTLALAATVLLALTLGGGGWLWVKSDRDARQAQATRDVNEALKQATALRELARTVHVGGAALFAQAREQAQRALALVENSPADAALTIVVQQLQAGLDEDEKDRKFLAALEAARLAQTEIGIEGYQFALERAVPLFRRAFQAFGLRPGEGEARAAAEKIRQRPAPVREAINAALDEWIELAATPGLKISEPHLDWLRDVVAAADPDEGWTRDFRAARAEKDAAARRAALEKLATDAEVRKLPARTLTLLAQQLRNSGAAASALHMLERAWEHHPADFWINHNLGWALQNATPPDWPQAIRYYTVAVALRPESPGIHVSLGYALAQSKGPRDKTVDKAIACYRKAIEVNPKYATAHVYLGGALRGKGQMDAAIESYRKALELNPKESYAYVNLGHTLWQTGILDEAIACHRKAIELDPKYVAAHVELGHALRDNGQFEEAIASYRKTIELNPKGWWAYHQLGQTLRRNKQIDEAIAHFRKFTELNPEVMSYTDLGNALKDKGQLEAAITAYRKALEFTPADAHPRYALRHAEQLAAIQDKLPAFRTGEYEPTNNDERLRLAEWCAIKKLHHASVKLYTTAFAANPKLAEDPSGGHQYAASASAVLAAAGHGEDAAKLDDQERTRLRKQALDWLRKELTLLSGGLDAHSRGSVRDRLRLWQHDSDLAAIRATAALAKLPTAEQQALAQLWADVAALSKKAATRPTNQDK